MAAMDAALIAGGAAIVGDVMSAASAQDVNQQSMAVAQANNQFNAGQAALNRQFQAGQVEQQEAYQTEMADTQMSRRVQDLKSANLNPALAYQLGGAAAPSGAAAAGSSASSAGNPHLINPGAAYGNLGSQVSSALALDTQKAQIDLYKAQADKLNAETNTVIPATAENIQSSTGLSNAKAAEVARNVKMLDIQLSPQSAPGDSMYANQMLNDTVQKQIRSSILGMAADIQQATMQSVIKARNDVNYADAINAKNIYNASDGDFGKLMAAFNLGKPLINAAGGALTVMGGAL